ncbi:glycosyltransferase [Gammaproteobacteria bacterium]|nr:glycosyltransferase [Gammaproteobacteria bacterium]
MIIDSIVRKSNVGVWTADFDDLNGQATITKYVVEQTLEQHCSCEIFVYKAGLSPGSLWSWFNALIRFCSAILRKKIDITYLVASRSHWGFIRDIPVLLLTKYVVPRIIHIHGGDIISLLLHRWYSFVARWLYSGSTMIVPSKHLLPELSSLRFSIHALDNPVSLLESELVYRPFQDHQILNRPKRPFVVCWNSNLMCSKGFTLVLGACRILYEEGVSIQFHVFGSPMGDHEMSQIKMQDVVDQTKDFPWICFHGPQPRMAVLRTMCESDLVTLPTFHPTEAQGIAAVEAMLLGKHLLLSATPVMKTTAEGYPAIYVKDKSISSVKNGILQARENWLAGCDPCISDIIAIKSRFNPKNFDCKFTNILKSISSNP